MAPPLAARVVVVRPSRPRSNGDRGGAGQHSAWPQASCEPGTFSRHVGPGIPVCVEDAPRLFRRAKSRCGCLADCERMEGKMAVITAIAGSAKKEGRFVVEVEGKPAFTVSLDIIERLQLRVGATVDDRLAAALSEEAAALGAYDRALTMLAFQPRSSRDLKRRLVRKGELEAHAERAVERLVANGLLDDAQFARQVARSKVVGQGASKRRLQQELFKRGVDRGVADEAIEDVLSDEEVDEGEIVERLARKKVASLSGVDAATRRRRLYGFLARRGYDGDVIRRTMSAVLELGDGAGDDTVERGPDAD